MFSFISQYFYSKYFLVIAAEKLKSIEIKCNVYLKWVEPINLHFPIAHLHYHYNLQRLYSYQKLASKKLTRS